MAVNRISDDAFLLDVRADEGVLITFNSQADSQNVVRETSVDGIRMHSWGYNNRLPQDREATLQDNNIIGELISTKRSLIVGAGIQPFKVVIADGVKKREPIEVPAKVQDFFDASEFHKKYIIEAANQVLIHGMIFAGLMPDKAAEKIVSMMAYKCRDIRIAHRNFGEPIMNYVFSDYNYRKERNVKAVKIPSLRKIKNAEGKGEWKVRPMEMMTHSMDSLFDNGTYAHPSYWGGYEWIELSNLIPRFHKANIKNGYTIRHHIEIPKTAFLDTQKYQQAVDAGDTVEMDNLIGEQKKKRQDFIDTMNKFLAGEDNAGRAIYTYFTHDDTGRKIEGISINKVEVDLKDEALLKLFEKSNQANISAQGIHPSIASIETQGKLSSGSEMRNAIEIYVKIKAPIIRSIILEPFLKVVNINGWNQKGVEWGFEDIVLNKLDEEPTGSSNVLSPVANGQ